MRTLDFADRSGECGRAVEQLDGTSYWIDDRQIASSFGRVLNPEAADLLSIALCCYAADRTSARGTRWSRPLGLRVPVSDPSIWKPCMASLEQWLRLLTGDAWDIEVVGSRPSRGSESQLALALPGDLPRAVGLFSGGLDSYGGASVWLDRNASGVLVLVGVQSSTVVGSVQRQLVHRLDAAYPGRVRFVAIPLHLEHSFTRDTWQRTRGFVFHALATIVASIAGTNDALVFENGYGALNPRLAEQQEGAQTTKSTHPVVVAGWNELGRSIGMTSSTSLPHRWDTKAELLRLMPRALLAGIRETESCDAFPLRNHESKQCGACGSCVLRRQALVGADLGDYDRSDYAQGPLGPSDTARLMAFQAWQFRSLSAGDWAQIAMRWPEITLGRSDQPNLEAEMDLAMLRRYGDEWDALATGDDQLAAALSWPINPGRIA